MARNARSFWWLLVVAGLAVGSSPAAASTIDAVTPRRAAETIAPIGVIAGPIFDLIAPPDVALSLPATGRGPAVCATGMTIRQTLFIAMVSADGGTLPAFDSAAFTSRSAPGVRVVSCASDHAARVGGEPPANFAPAPRVPIHTPFDRGMSWLAGVTPVYVSPAPLPAMFVHGHSLLPMVAVNPGVAARWSRADSAGEIPSPGTCALMLAAMCMMLLWRSR